MQRMRIKQWLLLLLRTLAIASLIMAFARPTMHAGIGGALAAQGRSSIALVLDNSLSMTLRDAGGAYFDQVRVLALGLVERMEDDEVFVLLTAGDAAEQQGRALDALTAAEITPRTVSVTKALVHAADFLESAATHPTRAIYYVGDLQQSTLRDTMAAVAAGDARVTLIPIGTREHANVAVTGVRVTSRVVEKGEPVHIEATIVSYASGALQGYVASLFLEGERLAQATLDLPPGVPTRATFVVTPQHRGWLSGRVHIEDDAFLHDNTHWFSLHVPEERNILIVRGSGEDASYIELALQSSTSPDRDLFTKRSIDESLLAATPLGAYDAVILLGLESLSSGEIASLTRYVESGGGLLLFPGQGVEDMNVLLENLGGGSIRGFTGEPGTGSVIATLDRVDLEHPLFEGVFELTHRHEIERPEMYYAIDYLPASVSEYTLMYLSNGSPFMQELRKGRGAAFLLAAPPDVAWTDLPLRGLFIPLLHRSIYYLSATESVQGEQLRTGESANLRLAGIAGGPIVRIITPEGVEVTPEQRSLFGAVVVQIDDTFTQPGIYDVRAGEGLLRRLAVNVDSRESNLATAPPEQAANILAAATGLPVRAMRSAPEERQALLAAILANRTGVEVWHVFLWITLCCLVAEMFVSMRWRAEPSSA